MSTKNDSKSSTKPSTHSTRKINPKNILNVFGKEVCTYQGKLELAHQSGLSSLEIEIISLPSSEIGLSCICKAVLVTDQGRRFTDIGEANPNNVPKGCAERYISVASTRAKSRVLSDAFNISGTLDDMTDSELSSEPSQLDNSQPYSPSSSGLKEQGQTGADKVKLLGGGTKPISEKQIGLIEKLAAEQSSSGENMAQSLLQKPLSMLTGAEANTLIRSLKNDSLY